jgi:hypothetical protein
LFILESIIFAALIATPAYRLTVFIAINKFIVDKPTTLAAQRPYSVASLTGFIALRMLIFQSTEFHDDSTF